MQSKPEQWLMRKHDGEMRLLPPTGTGDDFAFHRKVLSVFR